MDQIAIDTLFGDRPVMLRIYQVWINKKYDGLIMQGADGWITHFNQTTILQGDGVAVIIELIERNI